MNPNGTFPRAFTADTISVRFFQCEVAIHQALRSIRGEPPRIPQLYFRHTHLCRCGAFPWRHLRGISTKCPVYCSTRPLPYIGVR